MSSIEKLEKIIQYVEQYSSLVETYAEDIKKDLEILKIIHKNPEIIWYCLCYECAYEMITVRPGFMIGYSMTEIEKQFNKIKEWLIRE